MQITKQIEDLYKMPITDDDIQKFRDNEFKSIFEKIGLFLFFNIPCVFLLYTAYNQITFIISVILFLFCFVFSCILLPKKTQINYLTINTIHGPFSTKIDLNKSFLFVEINPDEIVHNSRGYHFLKNIENLNRKPYQIEKEIFDKLLRI